jgi:hypothetical protein
MFKYLDEVPLIFDPQKLDDLRILWRKIKLRCTSPVETNLKYCAQESSKTQTR